MAMPYTKSGKCGLMVYQRARYGQICYLAFIPYNPRTPAQVNGREIWQAVNGRWRTLTQAQMVRWNAAAETRKSKLRLTQGKPTGQVLFVKINYPLAYWGRDQFDLPPRCPRFPELAVSGFSVTNVGGIIKISLDCSNNPGDHTILRASAPLSAGRKTCTQFRIIGLCPSPGEGLADITALYTAKFGVPRAGSKIFLRVNQMIDGWQDKPVEFRLVVPAPQAEPVLGRPFIVVQSNHRWTEMDRDQKESEGWALTLSTGSTDLNWLTELNGLAELNRLSGWRGWCGRTVTGTEKGRGCWGRDWGLGVKGSGVLCLKTGHGNGGDPPLIPECLHTATIPPSSQHDWGTFKPP
jgi:hypothetical protein